MLRQLSYLTLAFLTSRAVGAPPDFILPGANVFTAETAAQTVAAVATAGAPVVHDSRLQLRLFASDPDIQTPIGVAVDKANRLFVLESHTHLQRVDYPGPRGDRIKIFTDTDRDGTAERVSIFAENIEDGMNIRFSPAGELYVVTSRAVLVLHDRDGDDVSESRTRVLHMIEPERVYDHAALLGIAFSPDGWLYVSRGNTGGSAWRIEGTDGTTIRGYGDGGNIIRSRADGSGVQEVATGFWNPFDLQFDAAGRLLATDNDPDSRGPNRLVHVIEGGDYGYQSLYGGSGIHPYLSWNGELPGSLPYAASLGEAPAGMLIGADAALPADYRDDVLAAIWEERSIVRIQLAGRGVSIAGTVAPLVQGQGDFRPVAFAADGLGAIYFTDWVKRDYPNHGRGRIWRLSVASAADVVRLDPAGHVRADVDARPVELKALYDSADASQFGLIRRALTSEDPFVRTAAVTVMARPAFRESAIAAANDPDPKVRLGAVLALRRAKHQNAEAIARRLLADPDPLVRRMTLIWIGSTGMTALEPFLERALGSEHPSPEIFEVYLATLQQLSPDFVRSYRDAAEPYARLLKRLLPPRFLESFVADERRPAALRALAVRHLDDPASSIRLLAALSRPGNPPQLRLEAVRSLVLVPHPDAAVALLAIVRNVADPEQLRADALLGLARQTVDASAEVLKLLDDPSPAVRPEAARYLRTVKLPLPIRAAVRRKASSLRGTTAAAMRDQLAFAVSPNRAAASRRGKAALASDDGDPDAGRRVFFSAPAACAQCHAVNRRGGELGPDLSNVGSSKTRSQILDSILRPSAEVSPEYQGWYIRTADGQIHTGRQIDVGDRNRAELYVLPGRFVTFNNVSEFGPMPQSLMPEELDANLTDQDMRDLLAFLQRKGGTDE